MFALQINELQKELHTYLKCVDELKTCRDVLVQFISTDEANWQEIVKKTMSIKVLSGLWIFRTCCKSLVHPLLHPRATNPVVSTYFPLTLSSQWGCDALPGMSSPLSPVCNRSNAHSNGTAMAPLSKLVKREPVQANYFTLSMDLKE